MAGTYHKLTSVALLLFLVLFNLALPSTGEVFGKSFSSCSPQCKCDMFTKKCCCAKKELPPGEDFPCYRNTRCMDGKAAGVICHALNHSTLVSEERHPVLLPESYHAVSDNTPKPSIFTKSISKPPGLS